MAIKDYLPSGKTVLGVVGGTVLGAGVMFGGVYAGMFDTKEVFVPSDETCDVYWETRNDRYMCILYGNKDPVVEEVEVEKPISNIFRIPVGK